MTSKDLALIIVDPQNDFCEGGGSLPIPNSNAIFPLINQLKKKVNFNKVFITKDMHPTHHVSFASRHKLNPFSVLFINGKKQELWPEHCIVGTHGSEIHKLLEIQGDQIIIEKGGLRQQDSYSGFGTLQDPSKLKEELEKYQIKKVFVVGLAYDYCVGSTALDAKKLGLEVFIINQCTKSATKQAQQAMRKRLIQNCVHQISLQEALKY